MQDVQIRYHQKKAFIDLILPIKRKARGVIKQTLPTCICCNHSSWLQLIVEREREKEKGAVVDTASIVYEQNKYFCTTHDHTLYSWEIYIGSLSMITSRYSSSNHDRE